MFKELLDKRIAVTELAIRAELCAELLPAESAALSSSAVDKRRQDFSAGRLCAHRAMQQLGHEVQAVTIGSQREPLWPENLVGSITHTGGFAAAAVALSETFLSLGIDAEQHRPMEPAVCERIANPAELAWIAAAESHLPAALMLFSAKESLHKAIYPLTGLTLGFQDAEIIPQADDSGFDIYFTVLGCERSLSGQWVWDQQRVYAAIMITADQWS